MNIFIFMLTRVQTTLFTEQSVTEEQLRVFPSLHSHRLEYYSRCLRSFTWEISYVLRVKMSSRTFNLSDCRARSSQLRRGLSLTPTGHGVHFSSVIRRWLSLTHRVTRALACRRLIHLNKAFLLLRQPE